MSELLCDVVKSDNLVDAKAVFIKKNNANSDDFTYAIETGKKGFLSNKTDYDVFQVPNLLSYNMTIEDTADTGLQNGEVAKTVFTAICVLTDLLSKISPETEVSLKLTKLNAEKQNLDVEIVGEYAKNVIEPYEKILSTISLMTNLILFKSYDIKGWHIIVDANGYANKANERIKVIAKKACEHVKATGKEKVLNPLMPSERYIVHLIAEEEGCTSKSIGNGNAKKIVISKK